MPLVSPNNSRNEPPYDPCGLKAASLFTDRVQLLDPSNRRVATSKRIAYDFSRTHRAWSNASGRTWLLGSLGDSRPPQQADKADEPGVSAEDEIARLTALLLAAESTTVEDFVTWMRASPWPTVRKPLLRLEQDLPAGNYTLLVANRFDVRGFGGRKSLVVSPWASLGGNTTAIASWLAVMGVLSLLLAAAVRAAACFSAQPARCNTLQDALFQVQKQAACSTSVATASSSASGIVNPRLRKHESDVAVALQRHRLREDKILARYAPSRLEGRRLYVRRTTMHEVGGVQV